MPTILRLDKLRVVIYPNDHRPAHIHVLGPNCEAAFLLRCPHGPPKLRESIGFDVRMINGIASRIQAELALLCHAWRLIHGHY